ncbi:MAG: ATP-binding protein, partial [Psychrosphaera sp.]|nr:ATP-binding protein [Psychrosphaera sp.]
MIEWISPLLLLMLLASMSLNFYQWQQLKRKERKHWAQLEYQKKSASEVKSRFIANISHEIRTPLNAILGHTQLLERDPQMNDEQLHSLSTILKSSTHLSDLINDLLEIASLESHTMALQCKDFDLADMITGLSNLFAKRCAQKQLRWRYINTQSGPIEVNGDMAKIRQILVKLLGNAIKFTHTGQITLSITHEHHNFCFSIEDTGPGIDEDQRHNIFKVFTQQSDQIGVGLGLAIAKSEIELMGGQLELQSKPGKG